MISLIIPHYNSSKELTKNLHRLVEQTSTDFEVIVVDDCSREEELNSLLEIDVPIKLNIIKSDVNQGPGVARNVGIKAATGEYILFVDSDDYIENNAIENLSKIIDEYYPDTIIFDYSNVKNDIKNPSTMINSSVKQKKGFIDTSFALVFVRGGTWGKCYKKEMIEKHQIKFLNQYRNEDMPFTKTAVAFSNKVYYLNEELYNYVDNNNSLMHNNKLLNEKNAINACEYLKKKIPPKYENELISILNYEYVYSVVSTKLIQGKSGQEIKEFLKLNPIQKDKYFEFYPKYLRIIFRIIYKKNVFLLRTLITIKKIIK